MLVIGMGLLQGEGRVYLADLVLVGLAGLADLAMAWKPRGSGTVRKSKLLALAEVAVAYDGACHGERKVAVNVRKENFGWVGVCRMLGWGRHLKT